LFTHTLFKKESTASPHEVRVESAIGANSATTIGREIKLVHGFYQAEGSAFKFSDYYCNKLWSTGRGAPFLQAEEVLNTAKTNTPDRIAGFNRYANDAFGWSITR
jgi:hypothetical protein